MAKTYDAVIIGAGHNGLVTACYLARAGMKVCVLEKRHVVGGCCVTEELWPGYRVSTVAYVNSLFRPEVIRDLNLTHYGFTTLPRNPSSFTPLPDGGYLMLGPDPAFNRRQISKFSKKDAEALDDYENLLDALVRIIEPELVQTPPDPFSGHPAHLWRLAKLAWRVKSLGKEWPLAWSFLTAPAKRLLDWWFESDVLKATLATDAIIGAFASPAMPGTAYVLLHHVMGQTEGRRGVWCYIQGGMGSITQGLAACARAHGAEVRCNAEVAAIRLKGDRVCGVALADGTEINASRVVSNADPHVTFEKLIDPSALPGDFVTALRRIDYSSASAKINLALKELPDFKALPGREPGPQHRGTIHIAPSCRYIEEAFDEAKYGVPSSQPILECTIPTVLDPTLAPSGKHIMSIFVQYAPYRLKEGSWDEIKEGFADRCLEVLAQYAPNIPDAVIHRQVISPLDLEREYSLTGGNIFQGAMHVDQLYCFRPVPGYADYRTPIRGLYLCGAATHPGGGVVGACGYNAAREILKRR